MRAGDNISAVNARNGLTQHFPALDPRERNVVRSRLSEFRRELLRSSQIAVGQLLYAFGMRHGPRANL